MIEGTARVEHALHPQLRHARLRDRENRLCRGVLIVIERLVLEVLHAQHERQDQYPGDENRAYRVRRPPQARSRPRLCAEADGYNLHAAVSVKDVRRDRLEHLCGYLARPPVANDRLSLLDDEREGPPPDEDAFDADADADDPKDWEQEGFDWAA